MISSRRGARSWCKFWPRPGEAAVTLGVGEEQQEEWIPEQLRRLLGGWQKQILPGTAEEYLLILKKVITEDRLDSSEREGYS